MRRDGAEASTNLQLGYLAQSREDFFAADRWFRKALEILERIGDEQGAAYAMSGLGFVAQMQGYFAAAERWYRQALDVCEKTGDKLRAALAYLQIGVTAELQGRWVEVGGWYKRAVAYALTGTAPIEFVTSAMESLNRVITNVPRAEKDILLKTLKGSRE
jgi:tetratricopeptide (TPR) repeat protein